MDMIVGFVTGNAGAMVAIGVAALPFLLPNKAVEKGCFALGKVISTVLRQKVGKAPGEKVERYFQGTLSHAIKGLNDGLDFDDKD